jgi:hypothetical protein
LSAKARRAGQPEFFVDGPPFARLTFEFTDRMGAARMPGHSPSTPTVLAVPGADPKLYNEDLAPVAPAGRHWGIFDIFAMWMSDVHSVGGYTFAASLFFLGLNGLCTITS